MEDRATLHAAAWAVAAVAAVLLALRLLSSDPAPPPVQVMGSGEQSPGPRRARETPAGPYVHVAGAVRRAGVYRLVEGSRVASAVRRAGGATARADLTAINLAARLQDGQQVVVPALVSAGGPTVGGASASTAPISLGTATAEQLDELDGIGPTLAERIVELRQERGGFGSLDQLDEVDGIGAKRLEALKEALSP